MLFSILSVLSSATFGANYDALTGEYISRYGMFSNKTVNLKFTAMTGKNSAGSIVVNFSELPNLGSCSGEVSVTSSELEDSIELHDYNGLKCTGLIGQKYDWITFQYSIDINAKIGKQFKGVVFVVNPDSDKPLISKTVKTVKTK